MNVGRESLQRWERFIPHEDDTVEATATLLASTLQSAGDGVIVTDLRGQVEFLNLAAERIIGLRSAEAEGRPLQEILRLEESDGRPVRGSLVELAIVSGAPIAIGKDLLLTPQSGAARQVEGEICVRMGGGAVTGSVITFRDVTARNWDELQKREEHKMRAVGQLAGAIAHDLNNLLTVIGGHREAIDELYSDSALRNSTGAIQQAIDQMTLVTRQLITLSRRELLSPKAINLNTLLEQISQQLRALVPATVDLTFALEPDLDTVVVDPAPMTQAILDLVSCCIERMPAGGKIEVATSNLIFDQNSRARHLSRYVELSVTDNGASLKGVPPEKLFEPTWTKGPGRPSGLGLFTIRNVVNAANGHLSVESEQVGAKFIMRFPAREEEGATTQVTPVSSTAMPSHPTILLVEDDDAIRILLRNSLVKRGYRVIEARDGSEGIFQADLYEEPIHLLISDVVMPIVDGPALARDLLKTRPEIGLLLISGCPEELVDVQQLVDRGAHFVQKPFSQKDLLIQVENILGEKTTTKP